MKCKIRFFIPFLGLGLLLIASAKAQTTRAAKLDKVVVTATRTLQPTAITLAQTYVIDRDEIEASGAISLAELLQRYAGVEIRASGGPGQPSGIFMRGANSAHTLVLIDGFRVGSATSGSTALENIALDLVERIEIVKGPLSSLYGADAMGGVVQIFTRGSDRPRLTAEAGVGNHSSLVFNSGFSAIEGKTSLTVDAGYRRISAPSATNIEAGGYVYDPDRDPYSVSHALIKFSHTFWQGEKISLNAWQSRSKTNFDAGPADNANNRQTLSGIELASENKILPWWNSSLKIGRTTDDSIIHSNSGGTFRTQQNQIGWQNELVAPAGKLLFGYAWLDQQVNSSIGYTQDRRTTQSVYASLAEQLDNQHLHASIRHDRDDQYGKRSTGSISYGVNIWPDELVYASYGKGFHAPSFNDLYYPSFSNPSLRPEKSKNSELGYRLTRRDYQFNLAVFDNQIDDLIAYNAAAAKPENLRRAHIKGWEASGQLNWNGFLLKGTLTAQKPKDADTGLQLQSRSKQFGSIAISTTQDKWNMGMDITASARRYDSTNETPASIMGGYVLLGAYVKYNVDKKWAVELTGTNLANRAYDLIKGYNPPGRYILLNIKFVAF